MTTEMKIISTRAEIIKMRANEIEDLAAKLHDLATIHSAWSNTHARSVITNCRDHLLLLASALKLRQENAKQKEYLAQYRGLAD